MFNPLSGGLAKVRAFYLGRKKRFQLVVFEKSNIRRKWVKHKIVFNTEQISWFWLNLRVPKLSDCFSIFNHKNLWVEHSFRSNPIVRSIQTLLNLDAIENTSVKLIVCWSFANSDNFILIKKSVELVERSNSRIFITFPLPWENRVVFVFVCSITIN